MTFADFSLSDSHLFTSLLASRAELGYFKFLTTYLHCRMQKQAEVFTSSNSIEVAVFLSYFECTDSLCFEIKQLFSYTCTPTLLDRLWHMTLWQETAPNI